MVLAETEIRAEVGSALHYAAEEGRIKIEKSFTKPLVKFLIAKGANVNAMCYGRKTPLHYAVKKKSREMTKLLLLHVKPEYIDKKMSESLSLYLNEIKKLKEEKISEDINLFDIVLTMNENQLTSYVRNENVANYLEKGDYKKEFPIYAELIERNYQKGKKRLALLKEGEKIIYDLKNLNKAVKDKSVSNTESLANFDNENPSGQISDVTSAVNVTGQYFYQSH